MMVSSVMGNPAINKYKYIKNIKKCMDKNKLKFNEIKELIPHREPFIYLDELLILKN